jgi:hypothetical protein
MKKVTQINNVGRRHQQQGEFASFSQFGAARHSGLPVVCCSPGEFRTVGAMIYWIDAELPLF